MPSNRQLLFTVLFSIAASAICFLVTHSSFLYRRLDRITIYDLDFGAFLFCCWRESGA
jgi:hypothetical protein